MTNLTFPVHDEPGWVCTRCGLIHQHQFSWAHRPVTDPGICTCGGLPVPANVFFYVKDLLRRLWVEAAERLRAAKSGQLPGYTTGAYGLWQFL